jgi:hypothetical protein
VNQQGYERIPRRSVLLGCALLTAVGVVYGLAEPARAQLTGTWDIVVDGCCDDEETSCHEEFTFVVTQSGNRLSGSLLLPEEIPPECDVTCTPAIPNCDRRVDLVGTVSGSSVDVTFSSNQSLNASCQICQERCVNCTFQEDIQTTDRLIGSVAGSTITGSWTSQADDTCETGGDPACGLITCVGESCSGTFQIAISGSQLSTPTPTPIPTPRPCIGDCDEDGSVTVDEIIITVNSALGTTQPSACPRGVPSGAEVNVALIIQAVNNALTGCGA